MGKLSIINLNSGETIITSKPIKGGLITNICEQCKNCVFCGSTENLTDYRDKKVCSVCKKQIKELDFGKKT